MPMIGAVSYAERFVLVFAQFFYVVVVFNRYPFSVGIFVL
jgi:hypothetical protein